MQLQLAPVTIGERRKRLVVPGARPCERRAAGHEALASACPVALITTKGHHFLSDRIGRSVLAAAGVSTDMHAKPSVLTHEVGGCDHPGTERNKRAC